MKKKGLIVLLLLVAMIVSIALSGCNLVKLNEDRRAGRVMATVSYEVNVTNQEAKNMLAQIGITDFSVGGEINRRELLSSTNYSINRMASLYEQYSMTYNYDFETVLGDTLDSLIANNYYVLHAIEYLLNNSSTDRLQSMYMFCRPDDYKAVYGNKLSAEGVLTMSEWYSAVGSVNATLQTMLDGYVENKEDGVRNDRISAADNKISEYYEQGYFVSDVYLVRNVDLEDGEKAGTAFKNATEEKGKVVVFNENGEKFVTGLYDNGKGFVLTGTVSADDQASDAPATSELDYKQVYAAIEMTKKNGNETDVIYIPRPASEASLAITRIKDADFAGNYIRTRSVTVSYSGRVFAEKTEDNDTGYTSKTFTSDAVEYKVAFPRNALAEKAEEVDYLKEESVRYATKETWKGFYDYIAVEGNYDGEKKELITENNAAYDALTDEKKELYTGLASLYTAPFTVTYSGGDKNVKDGYRQLRNTLSSAGIGFMEDEPADKNSAEYACYKYYNGIYEYYNEQFMSVSLDAVKYEIGLAVKNDPQKQITDAEVRQSYVAKISQDKAKYDSLSYADQIDKFFSNTTSIDGVYYVPMAALASQTYEVDPFSKSYSALFTVENGSVIDYNSDYVTEDNGKYVMKYVYDNGDGTYTINAFFVGAMLFSFGNDENINNAVKIDNGKLVSIDGYSDLSNEKKVEFLRDLVKLLKTKAQITEEDALQEDVTEIEQLFAEEKESVEDIIARLGNTTGTRQEILDAFKSYMAKYNDDSGKLSDPGYLITSGDVSDKWAMADFPDGARAIYYNLLAKGIDPNAATEDVFGEGMTYYGLHYMMVTFAPYYRVSLMKLNVNGEECYALPMDMAYNLAGDKQGVKIKEGLEDAKATSEYSAWQASFGEETIKSATVKNDKNYKSLVKDIEKESKQ